MSVEYSLQSEGSLLQIWIELVAGPPHALVIFIQNLRVFGFVICLNLL